MLMRVNEIRQSERELLIGIGRGKGTTAQSKENAKEWSERSRVQGCKCQTLNLANNAHLSAQHAEHVHVS